MKRLLPCAIAASALLASASHAAFHVAVDVDKPAHLYRLGDLVTIDLSLTTQGTHTVGAFGTYEYQASWDPAALRVFGSDPATQSFGNGSQSVFP